MESNQNISGSGPLPTSTVDEQGVQPQGIETNTQQPMVTPAVPVAKKRKEIGTMCKVWDHYERTLDSEGKLLKATCLYCKKMFACQSKKHGTSSLRNHIMACLKNPH